MSGYNKLVPEIIQSSIWNESSDIRIVWITLLAVKDENGYVRGDARTLARLANVPLNEVEAALKAFLSPDPHSHTPDHEGRRIGEAAGGWIVLNHDKYRGRDQRADHAAYVKEWRAKRGAENENVIKCDSQVKHLCDSVSVSDSGIKKGVQGETCEEPKPKPNPKPKRKVAGVLPQLPQCLLDAPGFIAAWEAWMEFRKGKRAPVTPRVVDVVCKRLSERPTEAAAALDTCMVAGWVDVRWDWIDNRNAKQSRQPRQNGQGGKKPINTWVSDGPGQHDGAF